MTRKMWDLIPVLDCSQLLKLCPSQCKLLICPITTSGAWVDSARRTMSGKSRRGSDRPPLTPKHGHFGTDRTVLRELFWKIHREFNQGCTKHHNMNTIRVYFCTVWRRKRQVTCAFWDRCSGLDRCKVCGQIKAHIRLESSNSTCILSSQKFKLKCVLGFVCE